MAIGIVDFPIESGDVPVRYVTVITRRYVPPCQHVATGNRNNARPIGGFTHESRKKIWVYADSGDPLGTLKNGGYGCWSYHFCEKPLRLRNPAPVENSQPPVIYPPLMTNRLLLKP